MSEVKDYASNEAIEQNVNDVNISILKQIEDNNTMLGSVLSELVKINKQLEKIRQ